MTDHDEIRDMIVDCMNRESKLTEWEVDFIDSLMDRDYYTDKQIEKLEKIWNRIT